MDTKNRYIEDYKNKSYIFNSSQSSMTDNLQENDRQSIISNLLRVEGSKDKPGEFYDTGSNSWRWCRIKQTKEEIKGIEAKYKLYQEEKIRTGGKPPTDLPPDLKEQKARLQARLKVHEMEAEYLKELLEKVPDQRREREEKIQHPSNWSSGQLQGGILTSIAGIRVGMGPDNVLMIDDPRSEYNTMPVWQFRSQICNPMFHEHRIREREAVEAGRKEGAVYMKPKWPQPGKWNRENEQVEYEDYHPEVIRRLKRTKDE